MSGCGVCGLSRDKHHEGQYCPTAAEPITFASEAQHLLDRERCRRGTMPPLEFQAFYEHARSCRECMAAVRDSEEHEEEETADG